MVTMIRALAGEPGIPSGFPILLDRNMAIIEPAFAWLLEHATLRGRSHATETVRTYGEHLYDWFDTLEQSELSWDAINESVLAAYRNRMLETPSPHTKRPYARSTINARIHSVCRFYDWAHQREMISERPFRSVETIVFNLEGPRPGMRPRAVNLLSLAQAERLPRPLRTEQLDRLFAKLGTEGRLAAEWALTAGLRRKEICGLKPAMIPDSHDLEPDDHPLVGIALTVTKGGQPRTVYPPLRLIDRTNWYIGEDRARIVYRCRKRNGTYRPPDSLLLTTVGTAMSPKTLTTIFARAFAAAGISGTLHWLRHTFAMVLLARLQILARDNPNLNPLKIVQVLMGHRSITTTAIYLRCVELYEREISDSLAWLYGDEITDVA